MPEVVLRNIRGALTQSAADAYTEVEVNLALSLEARMLYFVTDVFVSLDNAYNSTANANGTAVQWQICRQTATAMAGFNDSPLIWKGGIQRCLQTSGASAIQSTWHLALAKPYAIASQSLYFAADGDNQAAAGQWSFSLCYYPAKVSERQFWEASTSR